MKANVKAKGRATATRGSPLAECTRGHQLILKTVSSIPINHSDESSLVASPRWKLRGLSMLSTLPSMLAHMEAPRTARTVSALLGIRGSGRIKAVQHQTEHYQRESATHIAGSSRKSPATSCGATFSRALYGMSPKTSTFQKKPE